MISFSFSLDTRSTRPKKQIYIRTYYLRELGRLSTGIYTTERTFADWRGSGRTRDAKQLAFDLIKVEQRALECAKSCISSGQFDYKAFKVLFSGSGDRLTIEEAYEIKLSEIDKAGTKGFYIRSRNWLIQNGYKNMDELTEKTLRSLQNKSDLSWSTIGMYMRHLRAVFNHSTVQGIVKFYPFENYTPPTSENTKKALTDQEIRFLLDFESENEKHQKAVDFWKICYLMFGRYPSDLRALKRDQVGTKAIIFYGRVKTDRMANKKVFEVPMSTELKRLLDKYGNGKDHVFDFGSFSNWCKTQNKYLKIVGKDFSVKLTLQTARHSAATKLLRSGGNTKFIQDALGHSSIKTTEKYLGSFSGDYTQDMADRLVD